MKPKIIIRADGGTSIGMGHIVRCLALADMLKNDFEITFVLQQPSETIINTIHSITQNIIALPVTTNYNEDANTFVSHLTGNEIVLLDGYHFKTDYQKAIKNKGSRLVAIDDLHSWHQEADVIINHAEGTDKSIYSAEAYTQFCFGYDFILLRKEFINVTHTTRKIVALKKIFISMGAADEHNNTLKFAEALSQINDVKEINLMLSTINLNITSIESFAKKEKKIKLHFNLSAAQLVNLLQQCDASICPASSISLESCAVGITLITGFTADNQKGILVGLNKHKACFDIGNFNLLTKEEIKTKMENIVLQKDEVQKLITNQHKMIDGKSPERLLNVFKLLNN